MTGAIGAGRDFYSRHNTRRYCWEAEGMAGWEVEYDRMQTDVTGPTPWIGYASATNRPNQPRIAVQWRVYVRATRREFVVFVKCPFERNKSHKWKRITKEHRTKKDERKRNITASFISEPFYLREFYSLKWTLS